jgi:peptide/nickel transport system ATP-binding protein
MTSSTTPSMRVEDLSVGYQADSGTIKQVVEGLDFELRPGRILGLAGESGSGKSTAALAAIGYEKRGTTIMRGRSILHDGTDILAMPTAQRRQLWGRRIAYVPQSASMSLNPGTTIGKQLAQPLRKHLGLRGAQLHARQIELFEQMGLPEPANLLRRYPFQFSGGQQQRISLAIALSCEPEILILDEPTTGLDVTTQARMTKLLRGLVEDASLAALYISHDLALLGQLADDISVMYAGEVVERSPMGEFLNRPRHPYAQALFDVTAGAEEARLVPGIPGTPPGQVVTDACAFAPRCAHVQDLCTQQHPLLVPLGPGHDASCIRLQEVPLTRAVGTERISPKASSDGVPLLEVHNLSFTYRGAPAPTLTKVNVSVMPGEPIGVVGESGSGKSTLLRVIAGLEIPTAGDVKLESIALPPKVADRSKQSRQSVQLIFQNPDSSLNPRQSLASILTRPIRLFRDDISRPQEQSLIGELLDAVRLPASYAHRYPSELSGGQRQRVAIARAFAAKPKVLLCDEVTSALDVSVQATVLELLTDLAQRTGVGIVFVGHDLSVVRSFVNRVVVMRQGAIIEQGDSEQLFTSPTQDYTRELVTAAPALLRAEHVHALDAPA